MNYNNRINNNVFIKVYNDRILTKVIRSNIALEPEYLNYNNFKR